MSKIVQEVVAANAEYVADFGAKGDSKRPLLSNAARPLGRAIALSPFID